MMDRKSLAISLLLFLLLFCHDVGLAQDKKRQTISYESAISWLGDALAKAEQIDEYRTLMVLRERKNGELRENEFWKLNIRKKPKQIHARNLKPFRGIELWFHEGKRDGKIIAYYGHMRGCFGRRWAEFAPNDVKILKYERYPFTKHNICDVGKRFLSFLEKAKSQEGSQYLLVTQCKINKRSCSKLEVRHSDNNNGQFHKYEIYVDDEHQIPVRFAAYEIPKTGEQKPQLLEEYTFVEFDLAPGFTEEDFEENELLKKKKNDSQIP